MTLKFVVKKVHFVGIGGVGMSGIAEVLHNLGYQVSGSDIAQSVILTFVFAILVGLAMQKRLADVSMTESLKSVE